MIIPKLGAVDTSKKKKAALGNIGEEYSGLEKLAAFGFSTIESFPELFGIEPSEETQTFRSVNPVSGALSQVVGAFVPYVGAAKAIRAVPAAAKGLAALEALGGESVIARGALGAAGEAAAVEAGRMAISATPVPGALYEAATGDDKGREKPLGTMLGDSAFNIVGGAVVGGGIGAIASRFAKGAKIQDTVPGAQAENPLTTQIQELNEWVRRAEDPADDFTPDKDRLATIAAERNKRIEANLLGYEPRYGDDGKIMPLSFSEPRHKLGKLYRGLLGDKKNEIGPFLNRASSYGNNPDKLTTTRRLTTSPDEMGGYSDLDEMTADISKLRPGMQREDVGMYAQDFRTIQVGQGKGKRPGTPSEIPSNITTVLDEPLYGPEGAISQSMTIEQAAGRRLHTQEQVWNKPTSHDPLLGRARGLNRRFTNSKVWSDVGDGVRMAEEDDGLYVFNKLLDGDIANPSPGDKWAFWRSDRPDIWAPTAAKTSKIVRNSDFFPKADDILNVDEPLWRAGRATSKVLDENEVIRPQGKAGAVGAMAGEMAETLGTYAAPKAFLGGRDPDLGKAFAIIDEVDQVSKQRVDLLMHGERDLPVKGASILRNVVSLKSNANEGMDDFIRKMTQEELDIIPAIDEAGLDADVIEGLFARGEITQNVKDFFLDFGQKTADFTIKRARAVEQAVQSPDIIKALQSFQSRKAHYLLTRRYPGSYKLMLTDNTGNWVGEASGNSPAHALEVAKELVEGQAKRGREISIGAAVDSVVRSGDDVKRYAAAMRKPGFIKSRGDLIGYDLMRGKMTASRLSETVRMNLQTREDFFRDIALREMLAERIARLARRGRIQDAQSIERRLKLMQGDEGAFGKAQNEIVDKSLQVFGMYGENSATKIVRATQSLLSSWTFGFGNLPQLIMNLTGTFTNLMPHVSFLINASAEQLARTHVTVPLLDGANNVKGAFGVLSSWKVLKESMSLMLRPSKDLPEDFLALMKEAESRRMIAPYFSESQFGTDGELLRNPIKAIQDGDTVKMLNTLNQVGIAKTEEMNRAMVLTASYVLGKAAGLEGPRMIYFAQSMMAKVAFDYKTWDRATLHTTPLGSLSGTFKNWMFHYIGSMMQYAGAGKAGIAPLMWQTASTGVLGGAAATPFLVPVAEGFSRFFANQSLMESLYEGAGNLGLDERVSDGIMYGLPGAMGLSLSSQISSPGADPERDATMIFSFAAFDRMKALSGATKDAISAARTTGESPFEDENVRLELVRALAPRTIYRAMSLSQDQAVRSMSTGYDVTAPLGLGGALLYSAGFNPTELEKTYEVYNAVRDDQEKKRALVKELGQTLAQAQEAGDDRLANRVFVRAMALGVDTSSVLRSAKARTKRGEETQLDFAADAQAEADFPFMFDGQ